MDSLDFNLHQAILKSLATCYAGSETKSSKAVATGKAVLNGGEGVHASHTSYEDVLEAFAITSELLEEKEAWSLCDANAVIALAEYAIQCAQGSAALKSNPQINGNSDAQDRTQLHLEQCSKHVCQVLARLHMIDIERCLGAQGMGTPWVTADELACALVSAATTLASSLQLLGPAQAAFQAYESLKNEIANAQVSRVVEHILPCMNGITRAISTTTCSWTPLSVRFLPMVLQPLSVMALSTMDSISRGSFIHSSLGGRFVLSVLARYENCNAPFSTNFIAKCDTAICRAVMVSSITTSPLTPAQSWDKLVSGTLKPNVPSGEGISELAQIVFFAKRIYENSIEILEELEEDDDSMAEGSDAYEVAMTADAIIIATACCLAHAHDADHVTNLEALLSEGTPVHDSHVQQTAMQCLRVLAHSYPDLAEQFTAILRRFITSPVQVLLPGNVSLAETLKETAEALATCIECQRQDDMMLSTVYSLLNYLPSSRGDHLGTSIRAELPAQEGFRQHPSLANRTPEERHIISSNTLQVVAQLAVHFRRGEVTQLALSMLLQRIRNGDVLSERAALESIAGLAPFARDEEFGDVARTFTELGRAVSAIEDATRTDIVRRASLKLASNLDDKPELGMAYLREALVLFVDQSAPARHAEHRDGHIRDKEEKVTPSQRTAVLPHLLNTLKIIETLLASPKLETHKRPINDELVVLFRNLWFISTVLGLTLTSSKDTIYHKLALTRIAVKTPCLLFGTPSNYVDTELEYNPFIRKDRGTSSETLRSELEQIVHQHQSITARSLSFPQVVFLLAVQKLESMRAEQGDPSVILQYFDNDGVNTGPLAGPLDDVAQKVVESFKTAFDLKVRRHNVTRSIAQDLKAMVLICCGTSAKARKVALRSLDAIFGAFPVLLCDSTLLVAMLECLTLLRNACESEMDDEYNATFEFTSKLGDVTLVLLDNYDQRNEILTTFHQHTRAWLSAALAASPLEVAGLLQDYLDDNTTFEMSESSGMGKSVALDIAKMMPQSAREAAFPRYGGWRADTSSLFASAFGTRHTFGSEAKTVIGLAREDGSIDKTHVQALRAQLREISDDLRYRRRRWLPDQLRPILYRAAAVLLAKKEIDYGLLREIVFIPVHAINPSAMHLGVDIWAWLVDRRADLEAKLMVDVHLAWSWTVRRRRGLFSVLLKAEDPIITKTEYSPTDVTAIKKANHTVQNILAPHRYLLDFLSSRFQAYRYRDKYLVLGCMRTVIRACERARTWGKHPLCRELRMKIITLGFSILNSTHLEQSLECSFRGKLYKAALLWFGEAPSWSYGADRLQLNEDIKSMQRLAGVTSLDQKYPSALLSSRQSVSQQRPRGPTPLNEEHKRLRMLLLLHLENEVQRLSVWLNPLEDAQRGQDPVGQLTKSTSSHLWTQYVQAAWTQSPTMAVLMMERFKDPSVLAELQRLVHAEPDKAANVSGALELFLGPSVGPKIRPHLKNLAYWAPVSPVAALRYFLPAYNKEPLVIQYAMRTLEQHPVDLVFFYIPQVVQALRTDPLNYMERFIFETSKISQLFCHQMIWNMKANCFRDDLAEQPDPNKDKFERMVDLIVSSLSGEAQRFYEKEFGFFNEVTSISRKLMPFVKKTKPEKKAKIDEEMAKIKVEEGVYLPSHPEGRVMDIDRHSGRPLQSHAKTPFMATFKVSRELEQDYSAKAIEEAGGEHTTNDNRSNGANEGFPSLQGGETARPTKRTEETKLSAIFKVGDDCRQDVLAMQVIAQFKNMFNVYGLDLQVQPYKVLATGPGTGIIDVVPNATSRDEMGRAKINDLTEFFLFQFGSAESVAFQRARNNFIQSMAAYSVLCYILQIKDRHNGNIMIDGEGRITHIDFGFLFDIGPGGIKFEPNSFKLTHEMLTLMGGKTSQGYRQFRELTVKAFLACRPYVEDVISTCSLMMPTQLPSFKGEGTIHRLKDRFKPELTEREAARYMMGVIDNACENSMSIVYDQFQYYQNKIPYAS